VEVTVKKLRKPAIVYIFRIAVCSSLIVGVASVAKCWRQKPPNFAFAGSCTLSKYFACSLWLLCLLSTHADEQGVDISVTVCLCVCVFVRLRISPPRIKLAASYFARRFIGVQGKESHILVNFAPLVAQNRTNRPARGPRPHACKHCCRDAPT